MMISPSSRDESKSFVDIPFFLRPRGESPTPFRGEVEAAMFRRVSAWQERRVSKKRPCCQNFDCISRDEKKKKSF